MNIDRMFEFQYQNYIRKYPDVYRDFKPEDRLNDEQNKEKASQKKNVEVKEGENPLTIIGQDSCKSIDACLKDVR